MTPSQSRRGNAPENDLAAAYDSIASDWDAPGSLGFRSPQFAARMRAIVVAMLGEASRRERALDLGAGTGWMLDATAPLFGELIAIEHSAGMLEVCRRRIADLVLTHVRAEAGDAMTLDGIADASVDAIYAVGLLDAVPRPADVCAAATRVLRPGGLMVVSTSNGACPWYGVRDRLFGKADVRTGHYLTPAELTQYAAGAGLEPVSIQCWGAAPPGMSSRPAVAALNGVEQIVAAVGLSGYLGVLTASFRKS